MGAHERFKTMLLECEPVWFDPAEPIPGDPFVSFIIRCPCGHRWGECQTIGRVGLQCDQCGSNDPQAVWESFATIRTNMFLVNKPEDEEDEGEDDDCA
jgi:hypothetical protein